MRERPDDAAVSEWRQARRGTFERVADTYDSARPEYPEQLFDDLVEIAGLCAPGRLLEIGCATGKATLPLLARGYDVVCVEIGEQLARQAEVNLDAYPVEIHVGPFEDWEPGGGGDFDLVYAATAWHWLDPAIRYRKSHQRLRPSGHLAFWSAWHAFPVDFDPFFSEIQAVYEAIGESREEQWPPPAPDQIPDDAAEIEATGLFGQVQVRRYVWECRYTADEYIALLNTFSGHIAMDADKREYLYHQIRERLASRPDRQLRRDWGATLHIARRTN